MKRIAFFLFFTVIVCMAGYGQKLGLIINTNGDGYTNVRTSAKGSIVAKLYDDDMIEVDRCSNGWFHIASRFYVDGNGDDRSMPDGTSLWVHYSQLSASWLYDGELTITLRSMPSSKGSVVFRGSGGPQSSQIKNILDYKGKWVKVRLNSGKVGWVPQNIICSNSLTTCN